MVCFSGEESDRAFELDHLRLLAHLSRIDDPEEKKKLWRVHDSRHPGVHCFVRCDKCSKSDFKMARFKCG